MKENFERRGCCALSATKEHNMFNPKMEARSRDERHALQSERLRWTVKHEYENVPVYRARMDAKGIRPEDVHGLEDLKYLPFMEKTDLRDHFPYGLLAVPLHDIVRIQGSSGTTGRPIVSGYTQHDVDVWTELMARTISAAGGGADDIIQVAYGYGLFTGGLGAHQGAGRLGATVIPMSSGNTQRQIMMIKELGVTMLCCTPSTRCIWASPSATRAPPCLNSNSRPVASAPSRGRRKCASALRN